MMEEFKESGEEGECRRPYSWLQYIAAWQGDLHDLQHRELVLTMPKEVVSRSRFSCLIRWR